MPLVAMLRDDFPDTEKQLLVPAGWPACICIDDRPWLEALLTWTPAELIDRILMWFRRAAHGELHDARQPLEPILLGSPLRFIIARSILATDATEDLIAQHDLEQGAILRVKPLAETGEITKGSEPICIMAYRVRPERMQRLRHAPATLGELAEMLDARGIDAYADLVSSPSSAWHKSALSQPDRAQPHRELRPLPGGPHRAVDPPQEREHLCYRFARRHTSRTLREMAGRRRGSSMAAQRPFCRHRRDADRLPSWRAPGRSRSPRLCERQIRWRHCRRARRRLEHHQTARQQSWLRPENWSTPPRPTSG